MRIPFHRITKDAQPFSLMHGAVRIEGTLRAYRPKLVLLEATMTGLLPVQCYRCGATFDIMLEEKVRFLLSEGVFSGQDDEFDVVEMLDPLIDLDAVFDSEIALIESDYHSCSACQEPVSTEAI